MIDALFPKTPCNDAQDPTWTVTMHTTPVSMCRHLDRTVINLIEFKCPETAVVAT